MPLPGCRSPPAVRSSFFVAETLSAAAAAASASTLAVSRCHPRAASPTLFVSAQPVRVANMRSPRSKFLAHSYTDQRAKM